jgi:hypothetical protein
MYPDKFHSLFEAILNDNVAECPRLKDMSILKGNLRGSGPLLLKRCLLFSHLFLHTPNHRQSVLSRFVKQPLLWVFPVLLRWVTSKINRCEKGKCSPFKIISLCFTDLQSILWHHEVVISVAQYVHHHDADYLSLSRKLRERNCWNIQIGYSPVSLRCIPCSDIISNQNTEERTHFSPLHAISTYQK